VLLEKDPIDVGNQPPISEHERRSSAKLDGAISGPQKGIGTTLHGRAIDGAGGKPVMDAVVTFSDEGFGRVTTTDGLGTFVLFGASQGRDLRISIVKDRYHVQTIHVHTPEKTGSLGLGTVRLNRR